MNLLYYLVGYDFRLDISFPYSRIGTAKTLEHFPPDNVWKFVFNCLQTRNLKKVHQYIEHIITRKTQSQIKL